MPIESEDAEEAKGEPTLDNEESKGEKSHAMDGDTDDGEEEDDDDDDDLDDDDDIDE